jgi:hypothetical protein
MFKIDLENTQRECVHRTELHAGSSLGWGSVHLVRLSLFDPLQHPQAVDDYGCGAASGMRIGRGNGSTRKKASPVPLSPQQPAQDVTWNRTRLQQCLPQGRAQWEAVVKKVTNLWCP